MHIKLDGGKLLTYRLRSGHLVADCVAAARYKSSLCAGGNCRWDGIMNIVCLRFHETVRRCRLSAWKHSGSHPRTTGWGRHDAVFGLLCIAESEKGR